MKGDSGDARSRSCVGVRWAIIAIVVLGALYVASFGPACWITSRANSRALPAAYLPIGWLRLRFVDDTRAAIPGVGVSIDRWRGGQLLYNHKHPNVLDTKIPVVADKDGIDEWAWAPDDEVTFNFYREGYEAARGASIHGGCRYGIRGYPLQGRAWQATAKVMSAGRGG
jgi:hypothetical protein